MASRRSKPPAKLVANKRPRRKPTLPVTIEADDVKITKKYGHIYLRFSQAGKATGTSITDERGLISIIMALQGIAEQSGDIELMRGLDESLALLIPHSKYRSAQRLLSELTKARRFTQFVMARVREANFKRGARAQAIKEAMVHFQIADLRTAEKLLARDNRINPIFRAKVNG